MAGFGTNPEAPGGAGDMTKAVYDTDNTGVVDDSQRLGGQQPGFYATDLELSALDARTDALEAVTHRQNTDTGTDSTLFALGRAVSEEGPEVGGSIRGLVADGSQASIDLVLYPKGAGKTKAASRFEATEVQTTGDFVQDLLPKPTFFLDIPAAPLAPVAWNAVTKRYIDLTTGFDAQLVYYISPAGRNQLAVAGDPNRPFRDLSGVRAQIDTSIVASPGTDNLNNPSSRIRWVVFMPGNHSFSGGAWTVPNGKVRFYAQPGAVLNIFSVMVNFEIGRTTAGVIANPNFVPETERFNVFSGQGTYNIDSGSNGTVNFLTTGTSPLPVRWEAENINIARSNRMSFRFESVRCRNFRITTTTEVSQALFFASFLSCENLNIIAGMAFRTLALESVEISNELNIVAAYFIAETAPIQNVFRYVVVITGGAQAFGGWINRVIVRQDTTIATPVVGAFYPLACNSGIEIGLIDNRRSPSVGAGTVHFQFSRACKIREVVIGSYNNYYPTVFIARAANVEILKSHEQLDYIQVQEITVASEFQMRRVKADTLKSYRLISDGSTFIASVPTHIDCPYIKSISLETIRVYQVIFHNTLRTLNPIMIQPDTHGFPNACDIIFTGNVEIYVPDTANSFALDIKATGGFADFISNGIYSRRKINIKNHGNILTNANREDAFGGAAGNIINTAYHQETKGWFIQGGVPVLENTTPMPNYGIALPSRGLYVQQSISLFFVV